MWLLCIYSLIHQCSQQAAGNRTPRDSIGTIRHRTKRSNGCLSRDGMLHMMFKLGLCAEKKWRRFRDLD
ncbi:MAG: IS256 family transposase, partial [Candidatus Thiodiazotropha sp. (ex Lucinoma aequizonata)]|nr:IS256 family transposase [Candidatus Thiodiazotropha sp. (ex Lucinoma aequizonata)]